MAYYTQEEIRAANETNLEQYLRSRGESLKRAGSEYKWEYRDYSGVHDSIAVRNNKWYDHKNEKGGYAVSFLQEFYSLSFVDAVGELLNGGSQIFSSKQSQTSKKAETQASRGRGFVLPERAGNSKRLFAYLTKTRFLSPEIVQHFVKNNLIYQEKEHNNIVFVGTDANNIPKSASQKSTLTSCPGFKMTVSGSDTNYCFCYRGPGKKLFVFEAAVDLLSYLTLYSENWQDQSYIALDGLSQKGMLRFLEENENIKEVNICFDYDPAGIEAYDKCRDLLLEKGYLPEQVKRIYPLYKDWNEMLKEQNGVVPILPQMHPKIEGYHAMVRNMGILYSKTEHPYIQWKKQKTEKLGVDFLIKRLRIEYNYMEQVQKEKSGFPMEAKASVIRIADAAVSAMCELQKAAENLPAETMYWNILKAIREEYKPYTDKQKLLWRENVLKREIGKALKAHQEQNQSLFCCLRSVADMAIRLKVYIDTDYIYEQERRKSLRQEAANGGGSPEHEPEPEDGLTMSV